MYGIVGVEVLRCVTSKQSRMGRFRWCALLVHEVVKNRDYRSFVSDVILQALYIPRSVLNSEMFPWDSRVQVIVQLVWGQS